MVTKSFGVYPKGLAQWGRPFNIKIPVSGCVGWWYLGDDLERSAVNLADGRADADIFGDIGVSEGYLSLQSKAKYLRSRILLGSAWTMAAVFKTDASLSGGDNQAVAVGTSGDNAGGHMYVTNSSQTSMASYPGGVVNAQTAAATATSWKMMICSADGTEQTIRNMTTGAAPNTEATGSALSPSTSFVHIGSGTPASAFGGIIDESHVSVWPTSFAKNDDPCGALYDMVKTHCANRGITI